MLSVCLCKLDLIFCRTYFIQIVYSGYHSNSTSALPLKVVWFFTATGGLATSVRYATSQGCCKLQMLYSAIWSCPILEIISSGIHSSSSYTLPCINDDSPRYLSKPVWYPSSTEASLIDRLDWSVYAIFRNSISVCLIRRLNYIIQHSVLLPW